MNLHERFFVVKSAESDLDLAIDRIAKTHELTEAETLAVVHRVLSDRVGWAVKMMIRQERHGTTETKGDEE